MLKNFRNTGLIWCLFFIGTFALSDRLSAGFFKEIFHRIRPCNNLQLVELVHSIVPCGSGYSFPSSHATNHFALAVFGALTLHKRIRWIWYPAILWAVSVSYAQVYVGVHFPMDVICGAMLGVAVGIFTARLFHWKFSLAVEEDRVLLPS